MNLILYSLPQLNFLKKKILILKFKTLCFQSFFLFFNLKFKLNTYNFFNLNFFFFINFFNEVFKLFNFFIVKQEIYSLFNFFKQKKSSFISIKKFFNKKKKLASNKKIKLVNIGFKKYWFKLFFFKFIPQRQLYYYKTRNLVKHTTYIKDVRTNIFFFSSKACFNYSYQHFFFFIKKNELNSFKFTFTSNKGLSFKSFFKLLNFIDLNNAFSLFFLPSSFFIYFLKYYNLSQATKFLNKNVNISSTSRSKSIFNYLNFFKTFSYQTYSLFSLYHYFNTITFFFKDFFNLNIFIKLFNSTSILKPSYKIINFFYKKMSYKLSKFHHKFYAWEFLEILCLSFLQKDLTMFLKWLTSFYEKIYFKLHKKFLQLLKFFFKFFFPFFKSQFSLKGLFLDVRGKLGVAGNSKKRHYYIKEGALSKSSKIIKFFNIQGQVRTKTGVLGITCFLTY